MASFYGDDTGLNSPAVFLVVAQAELDARLGFRHYSRSMLNTIFFIHRAFFS
jgi:hypothetical protein